MAIFAVAMLVEEPLDRFGNSVFIRSGNELVQEVARFRLGPHASATYTMKPSTPSRR